jgi:uncharacterized repeat protein (TIGR03803 family)
MRPIVVIAVGCGSLMVGCAGLGQNLSTGNVTVAQRPVTQDARRDQPTFKLVYAFPNRKAGYLPYGSLLALRGSLYGTTSDGGSECGSNGCGTVFSLTLKPSVKETVLHSFANGPDGWTPYSGVTALGNSIYGTTVRGGIYNGVVYSVDLKSGHETVLHQFQRTRDGRGPVGGLAAIGNMLYGTTSSGYDGRGAVFSITPSGQETVVYRFKVRPDGQMPKTDLLTVGNVLYGTTESGGVSPSKERCHEIPGCGTVFAITPGPSGAQETVLYRFRGGPNDGAVPMGGLIYVNGLLYGVTAAGGDDGCDDFDNKGCGTVFSLNPSTGQETIVYKFKGGNDAVFPVGNLAHFNGTLYGAAYAGGLYSSGAVFSMKLDGSGETVLHSFSGGAKDGASPEAGVVLSNGMIYGTTGFGGGGDCTDGCGTIYSITP